MSSLHRAYAAAGAVVHTANTFRTQPRAAGDGWAALARSAVALARAAVPPTHRVAGAMAPLEDCYRPDLSPAEPRPEHRAIARCLAGAKVDLLLCETFPHPGEALVAVEEAVATGLDTWVALTAGPQADLLTTRDMREAARRCVEAGARAVLVNCTPAVDTLPFVEALTGLGVPVGAYANAGDPVDGLGWETEPARAAAAYAEQAATWIEAGATLVGSCCGTGPAHVRELAQRFAG